MANWAEATPPATGLTHPEREFGTIGMHEAQPARLPVCP